MTERNELRVFHKHEEMQEDYRKFCEKQAEQFHQRDMTARANGWRVRWKLDTETKDITSQIAGMSFNRIRCDLRASEKTMMYLLSRLRCRHNPVEQMQVFYKEIR